MIKLIWLLWPFLIELCSVIIMKWRTWFQSFSFCTRKKLKRMKLLFRRVFCVSCRIERTWPVVTDEWSWLVLGRILYFVRLVVSDEWNNKAIGRKNRQLYSLMFFPYIFPHLSIDVEQRVCNINDRLVCVLCNVVSSFFILWTVIVLHTYSQTSVHERLGSRTVRFTNKFSEHKASRMAYCVSSYEHASRQNVDKNKSHWTTF